MRTPFLLALALLALLALPAVAEEAADTTANALPDNLLVDTLPNGLEIVIEERHSAPLVHVRAYMRIGSLYEQEYLGCGLSHYMEHIVSGGSTRREEKAADGTTHVVGRTETENVALLKGIGSNSNASTYFNFTNYYITTQSEMAETAVDLISSYLQHCQFDPVEVAREQRVVQQELLRNLDNPGRSQHQLFAETMFKVHPVRVPIIGYVDDIERVTRDDMMRFYNRNYTPQNCVVSIVGDIDKHEMLELVKAYFGDWKRKPLAPYMIPEEPEQTSMRWVEKAHGATKTCSVTMGVPSFDMRNPDMHALDLLANVLGLGASSRLAKKFENDPTREVSATGLYCYDLTPVYGAGRFTWGFSTDTVEHARQLVSDIWNESVKLKEELVQPEEIARALKQIEKSYWTGRADIEQRAQSLASNQAWLSDPLFSDSYLDKMHQVTPEQIRDAARKYLRKDKLNVAILTPPQPETSKQARAVNEAEGQVRKVVLDNGLTLLLKRIPDYGMVDVAAAFGGGVIYEDEKTNGLFFLMANTFWRGTQTRPFPVLVKEMDELGMALGAESHNNLWYVKMNALASDLDPAMDIFADVLLQPTVDEMWVARVKDILLHRVLPNLEVSADEMVQRVLRQTLYTISPYQRQRYGTSATVQSFSAADVRALYETYARPNNCVLAIYGDIDPDATLALVKAKLGEWKKGEIPASFVVSDDPGIEASTTVDLENNQVRTNYRLAWRSYPRQAEDERAAVSVMNGIMGANGWLHDRLRGGSNDYVYAVYSVPYAGDSVGHFFVNTDFSPADEEAVVAKIDGVIEDMKAGKFTDEELELAKKMLLCYDALQKKDNANVTSGDALNELYGDGYDHDKAYYERVKKVTREDVLRVANETFNSPALRIFVRPAKTEPAGG